MLKRNSKAMAIVLTLCFCFAFLIPAFVVPDAAQAAASYRALSAPVVGPSTTAPATENLGCIEIDFTSGAEIKAGDVLTVSFPSNVTASLPAGGAAVTLTSGAALAAAVNVVIPVNHPQTGQANGFTAPFDAAAITAAMGASSQSFNINFTQAGSFNRAVLYVYLNGMNLNGCSGDLTATIMGSTDAIPMGTAIVGKVSTDTGTAVTIKGVTSIGTSKALLEPITLIETKKNSLATGEVVKFKLPAGFRWTGVDVPGLGELNPGVAGGNWAWLGSNFVAAVDADTRILNVFVRSTQANATFGRFDVRPYIQADDSVAKKGDVIASVYSDQGHVTAQDITVANYGTYAAPAQEGTVAELIAGKSEQKLGTFYVTEELPASLVPGRTIKLTLPSGVKWWGGYRTGNENFPALVLDKGNNIVTGAIIFTVAANTNNSSDEGRSITLTLTSPPAVVSTTAAKIKFKDFKVDVSPAFSGDIKVTVGGTAGATGEVKVATAKVPVELSVESATKVRIGEQKQAGGVLVIKETKKDNIAFRNTAEWKDTVAGVSTLAGNNRELELTLPLGCQWAALPKVEVTEGDLQLDVYNMAKTSVAAGDNRRVRIPVKSSSMTASTIKVSDISIILDRTVPEGDLKVSVGGLAVNELPNVFPNDSLPEQLISTVVTPAPDQGTEGAAMGQFSINSNIYYVNGVAKVMDSAPYIKGGRTFVPVRFLAYACGLTDNDIQWDDSAKKATLTKGDKVVELTIGSTTIIANGEEKTMDVAPELSGGRTMLPARFVAENLGATVGWDPNSKTVLISK